MTRILFTVLHDLLVVLALSGCAGHQDVGQIVQTNGEECVRGLLIAYVHLESYKRVYGHFPAYVTAEEARHNGWTCHEGSTPYRYVLPSPHSDPVLIDANPHLPGYLIVFGRNKVAVIPADAYGTFSSQLKRGVLNLSESWIEMGKSLH